MAGALCCLFFVGRRGPDWRGSNTSGIPPTHSVRQRPPTAVIRDSGPGDYDKHCHGDYDNHSSERTKSGCNASDIYGVGLATARSRGVG